MGAGVSKTKGQVTGRRFGNNNADFNEQTVGSDEVQDEPGNTGEHILDSMRKVKNLFECEIIPASKTFISVQCRRCRVYSSSYQSVMCKDKSYIVFGLRKCDHKVRTCAMFAFINGRISNMTYLDDLKVNSFYCRSSMTNNLYCVENYSNRVNLIEIITQSTTSELVSKELFRTEAYCHGITCFDGGFALLIQVDSSFDLPLWQIHCVDLSGNIKRYIYRKPGGGAMFTEPTRISSNYDEYILYVIDNNSVLVFDVNGVKMNCIQLGDLNPTRIASDPEDNIFVVCGRQLLQFNSKYDKRVLLGKNTSLKDIEAVAWIDPPKCLAIVRGNELFIYRMV